MGKQYKEGRHSLVSAKMYRVSSSSNYRWDAQLQRGVKKKCIYDHIREQLGVEFTGNHMPKDLKGVFYLEGIKFEVISAHEKKTLMRTYITCPECEHRFAAGRAGQHICKPKGLAAVKLRATIQAERDERSERAELGEQA